MPVNCLQALVSDDRTYVIAPTDFASRYARFCIARHDQNSSPGFCSGLLPRFRFFSIG
jgi:hypothetical protein